MTWHYIYNVYICSTQSPKHIKWTISIFAISFESPNETSEWNPGFDREPRLRKSKQRPRRNRIPAKFIAPMMQLLLGNLTREAMLENGEVGSRKAKNLCWKWQLSIECMEVYWCWIRFAPVFSYIKRCIWTPQLTKALFTPQPNPSLVVSRCSASNTMPLGRLSDSFQRCNTRVASSIMSSVLFNSQSLHELAFQEKWTHHDAYRKQKTSNIHNVACKYDLTKHNPGATWHGCCFTLLRQVAVPAALALGHWCSAPETVKLAAASWITEMHSIISLWQRRLNKPPKLGHLWKIIEKS